MTDGRTGGAVENSIAALLRPARPDIAVRPFTASDQAFCRALFHDNRGTEFARLNLDSATLTVLLDQQFHAQQLAYRQAFPDADHVIIEYGGRAVGRLMTACRDTQTLHVIDIVLSSAMRGRGIGTDVIQALEHAAHAKGMTRLTLSVLRSNDGARRLYQRLGFSDVEDSDADARVAMVKQLA